MSDLGSPAVVATVSTPRVPRSAVVVFVAVEGVALMLFMAVGHKQWFAKDEWDYLATRRGNHLGDLLRPHNEHWSTLPILVYRLLFRLVGLHTYVPYQLVCVLLHLTVAALLLVVMRRADIGPWVAVCAASVFALLGSGSQDIVWAIGIGFAGSLVFGLTHLLLSDHDGPIDRRDRLGLAAGLAGLMCSGVAVPMVAAVGLSTLVRRGWRVALWHTVPLATVFGVWFLLIGRGGYAVSNASLGSVLDFVGLGLAATVQGLGQAPGAALVLAGMLGVGLVVSARRVDLAVARTTLAAPAGLLAGALIFLCISGYGRAGIAGPTLARQGRFVHVVAALSIAAFAIAAQAIVTRWRVASVAMIALVAVSIAGNIDALVVRNDTAGLELGSPGLMLAFSRVPFANNVPSQLQPAREFAPGFTIGWLLENVRNGRIPSPLRVRPADFAMAQFRLSILQRRVNRSPSECKAIRGRLTRHLVSGDEIRIAGKGDLLVTAAGDGLSGSIKYNPTRGNSLLIVHGPLAVSLSSPATPVARICN